MGKIVAFAASANNRKSTPLSSGDAMTRRKPDSAPRTSASHLRRTIAAAAARLMAEDGMPDYGSAKRKAAKQLGVSDSDALPTNDEIESELREYQALFQDEEHHATLRMLRSAALDVMQFLIDFRPCLTGQVLDGTAGRFSHIELELFADSSKDVEIFLLSHDIDYAIDEVPRRGPESPEARLRMEWEDVEVHILVYPVTAERSIPRNAHSGRSRQRARLAAVAELLTAEP